MQRTLILLSEILGFTLLVRPLSAPVWNLFGNAMPGSLCAWLIYAAIAGTGLLDEAILGKRLKHGWLAPAGARSTAR